MALGLAVGPELLAACSSSPSTTSAAKGSASLADVSIQLNYLENVQFAGTLMAMSKGYYKDAGLNVTVLPGGPNLAPEPVVVSGRALVGVTHTAEGAQAILNGAPLKIIGAAFQKSPTCLVSRASNPIRNPQEMIGKTIGVSDTNLPIWKAFLKVNNIPPSSVKVNTVEFSTQPLADGQIDGLIGFYTNEPIILDLQGVPTYAFLLADFGYPIVDDIYIARSSDLADASTRKQIVGLMTGEAKGWRAAFADPHEAASLAVYDYGKSLHLVFQQQFESVKAEQALVTSPATASHGLLWMTPETVAETVKSLALGGTNATPGMFTNEILTEVYSNGIIS
ncbi:MAG: ABC transporter substrate-binding protein [Actinomycetota bacterium]|jgi:ABC-type nitrate/sulfonate/bicarbonate transport system substrate-binding protein|nr:ABC transporter substrate-binding protein [Actinomycetota bacterium]